MTDRLVRTVLALGSLGVLIYSAIVLQQDPVRALWFLLAAVLLHLMAASVDPRPAVVNNYAAPAERHDR